MQCHRKPCTARCLPSLLQRCRELGGKNSELLVSSASEAVRHVSADMAAAMLEGVSAAVAAFSGELAGLPSFCGCVVVHIGHAASSCWSSLQASSSGMSFAVRLGFSKASCSSGVLLSWRCFPVVQATSSSG